MGMRWVNRRFYERVFASMPDAVEVVEARRGGKLVGMAFNLASRERLYGRYWGAIEEHPFLHFNVALYHSIEECIRRGVSVFPWPLDRDISRVVSRNGRGLDDRRQRDAARGVIATRREAPRQAGIHEDAGEKGAGNQ